MKGFDQFPDASGEAPQTLCMRQPGGIGDDAAVENGEACRVVRPDHAVAGGPDRRVDAENDHAGKFLLSG
ncbi:MAG: hypothetical protein L6W00_08050 [Lentisphaeria bacterium]|nr:MAG: hypothetical protein L6W00_08050 [Lentisphaeria bacterium]